MVKCTPPSQISREKNSEHGKHERTRKLLYGSKQLLTDNNYSQGLNVKRDQNAFLVSPFYGLCLWQIPADASSPFLW